MMPTATYCTLVDEVCRLTLLPNPHTLYEHTALSIDGIDISLVERHEPANEVGIQCDLGPLPGRQREAVLLRLLEINFHLFTDAANSTCTVNPITGRATLAAVIPLQHARAAALLELLGQLADMAKAWRQSYFLGVLPTQRTAVSRGAVQ